MEDSNVDGDGGGGDGVDGDGSRGTSPSQQGARTETSIPRNWSSTAAVLRNFTGKTPIDLGFSRRRPFIGGRAMSEGSQGPHTWWWRGQEGTRATLWCASLLAPLQLSFGLCLVSGKNRRFGLRFVQFQEYILCNFSETQKQQKTGN
jgi:hypothetical protein